MKKQNKEKLNFLSLIIGIILIIVGLFSFAITLPNKTLIIIAPISSLIIGAILALMGGLRKWS